MRTIETPTVTCMARALQVTRCTMHDWINKLVREPLARQNLPMPELTRQEFFAIAAGRAVRLAGESYETAEAAYAFLSNLTPEQLESLVANGRRYLLVCNGHVVPRLLGADSLFDGEIQQILRTAQGVGLHAQTFDMLPLLSQIVRGAQ